MPEISCEEDENVRKALLFALMLTLLLTACGGEEQENAAAKLQQEYAAVENATLEAEIICHYEDEVREYTLLCAYTPEKSTVTVLAPENLSGISASVEGGMLTLSYDDLSLDAGTYSAAAISPVVALPKLMEAAAWGYPAQQSEEQVGERTCIRMGCDLSGEPGTLYTTWFDKASMLPLKSEISVDDVLVFEVGWTRFEVNERADQKENGTDTQESGSADAA